jgi:two-component system chemotaxis response regulator CheV
VKSTTLQQDHGILLESGTNEVEFLEFSVAGLNFGVNVAKVLQAITWKDSQFTAVPMASDGVLGFVHFRGVPISVIDLRHCLMLDENEGKVDKQLLLVMEFNNRTNAFLIDEIQNIHRFSWDQFTPLDAAVFSGIDENVVIGTITVSGRIVMILDMEAIMARIDPSLSLENHIVEAGLEKKDSREDLKLVFAEDSATIRQITLKALSDAGFKEVRAFPTGKQALEFMAQAKAGEVDLILSDIEMPELDGLSLCRKVREMPTWRDIPFIAYSSLINEHMKRKCEAVGINESFAKPSIVDIVSAIDRHCLGAD